MSKNQSRILIVEDEPHLAFNLEYNLKEEGFDVLVASDGKEALEAYRNKGPFSLIILDVMMPELNGFEVASVIRANDRRTQILMLTARAAESDVIQGLETGVDDYMTKPFSLKELILRVKRMAIRSEMFAKESPLKKGKRIRFGQVTWNLETLELTSPRGQFILTVLEAKVLREFISNPETVLSRKYLLNQVWGMSGNVETRTVDNFVMRLRKYIEVNPAEPEHLKSVRGRGYKFSGEITSDGE